MSIISKIIITSLLVMVGATITGFVSLGCRLIENLCIKIIIMCVIIIVSCLIYTIWQL